jgi:uncharacterized membrane protein YbhN (UPF0104 family)
MSAQTRRLALRRALYLLVSIALLAGVWHWFDGRQALVRLQAANPWWLAMAFLLLTVQTVASALRWRLTSLQLGLPLTRATAIGHYYISMLCNLTLPGGMLGDAGRAWHHRQAAGLATSASAVVLERLVGQLAMVLTLVLAGAWQLRHTLGSHSLTWLFVIASLAVSAALAPRLPKPKWLARFIEHMQAAWFAPGVRIQQGFLTLLILACSLLAFYACAKAVGVNMPLASALLVLPATLMVMTLPVSVAGWGVREAAAALLWPLAMISSDAAVAASLAYGIVATLSTLPAIWWLRGPRADSVAQAQ